MLRFVALIASLLVGINGAAVQAPTGFTYLGSSSASAAGGIGVQNILNYYLSNDATTWAGAWARCEGGAGGLLGGRLLTISNSQQFADVSTYLLAHVPMSVWTSAVGTGMGFVWGTMEQMQVSPSFWGPGHPGSAAYDQSGYLFVGGVLSFQKYMGSTSNGGSLRFVCEAAAQD